MLGVRLFQFVAFALIFWYFAIVMPPSAAAQGSATIPEKVECGGATDIWTWDGTTLSGSQKIHGTFQTNIFDVCPSLKDSLGQADATIGYYIGVVPITAQNPPPPVGLSTCVQVNSPAQMPCEPGNSFGPITNQSMPVYTTRYDGTLFNIAENIQFTISIIYDPATFVAFNHHQWNEPVTLDIGYSSWFGGGITNFYEGSPTTSVLFRATFLPPIQTPADLGCGCDEPEALVANPINVKSGNTFVFQKDYSLPGLNGGLHLERTWNSLWQSVEPVNAAGLFGDSWRSSVEQRVTINTGTNTAEYWRPDGSIWTFKFDATTSTYQPQNPANAHAAIQIDSNSNRAVLILKDGTKKLFSLVGGQLLSESDRNGNSTSYTYDSSNRVSIISDPAGRRLYLNYADSRFPFQVTNVNSDAGISTFYKYDSSGRLIQVTHADKSTINFQYDSNSLLTAVTDTNGKLLESHTYDGRRRGLTSSRANGVDAVTVSYPN